MSRSGGVDFDVAVQPIGAPWPCCFGYGVWDPMKFSALPPLVVAIGAMAVAPVLGQVGSRGIPLYPGSGNAARPQDGRDRHFVMAAAVFCKFTVVAGRLAMIEARDGRLREIAALMAKDHTTALAQLRAISLGASIALPAVIGPDEAHRAKIASVRDQEGATFDRAYRAEQMDTLQDAAALLQSYAATGGNGPLRSWAKKTLERVRQHRQLLTAMTADRSSTR
jgi:putative membrane protein